MLAVPHAAADHNLAAGDHVVEWTTHVYSTNAESGWDGDNLSLAFHRPHNWTVIDTRAHLSVAVNLGLSGSNAQRDFFVDIEGQELVFCTVSITTSGSLAQRESFGGGAHCPVQNVTEQEMLDIGTAQNWTFRNMGGGTVNFLRASVYLIVLETVNMDLDITTAFDYWLPLGFALFAVFFGVMQGFDWLAAGGTVAVVATLFYPEGTLGVEPVEFAIVFTLAGLLGEYVAYRRQDQIARDRRGAA